MALTGFTRTGHCVEKKDDEGSHHICIDLSSESLGGKVSFSLFCAFRLQTIDLIPSLTRATQNFCEVTGQDDWCDSKMKCNDGSKEKCPGKPGSDISSVELSIISCTPVNNLFQSSTGVCASGLSRAIWTRLVDAIPSKKSTATQQIWRPSWLTRQTKKSTGRHSRVSRSGANSTRLLKWRRNKDFNQPVYKVM